MSQLQSIYSRLPVWAQHAAVSGFGLYWYLTRFGGTYRPAVEAYRARDGYGPEQWRAYQEDRLRQLLSVAADRVPYYRQAWSAGAKVAARSGRLAELPVLDKEPVRADAGAFVRDDVKPRQVRTFHTSGSTGTPIRTIWNLEEIRMSRAVREVRSNGWAGVSFNMPRATFSGRMVVPDPDSRGPYYRFNVVERQIYFSAFHLRPETAGAYVEALWKHQTRWLSGYAVSFYLLAQSILEQGLRVPPLSAVITTSEKVTREMRSVMERAFQCRVYEEYGSVENIMLATECEAGNLHVSPDVGIVEILRPDGSACDPLEIGEVVATGLMREYQPFVRYRVGDLAAWDPEPCRCGRAMPVIKEVAGRLEDVVTGPDGRELVRFHGLFVDQPNVREAQVIQETLTDLRIKVVATPEFGPRDRADIIARVHSRLGSGVNVTVEVVPNIPRTKNGKFKAVISHVKRPALNETGAQTSGPRAGVS